jgi:hypothetical protein
MSIFDFLTTPLADDDQVLTRDVKALVQDLQKARPPDLPQLTAEAQAALADEQALTADARGLVQDLSLFPASDQPVLSAELERILSDGQALADARKHSSTIRRPSVRPCSSSPPRSRRTIDLWFGT